MSTSELEYSDRTWEELIGEIFRVDDPPRWIIFLAGRTVYLIDRTKWGRGQYLLFDLDEIFGRRDASTLRATAALLSARRALPGRRCAAARQPGREHAQTCLCRFQ